MSSRTISASTTPGCTNWAGDSGAAPGQMAESRAKLRDAGPGTPLGATAARSGYRWDPGLPRPDAQREPEGCRRFPNVADGSVVPQRFGQRVVIVTLMTAGRCATTGPSVRA